MERVPLEEAFRKRTTELLYAVGERENIPKPEIEKLLAEQLDLMCVDFMRPILELVHATGITKPLMDTELNLGIKGEEQIETLMRQALRTYKQQRKAPLN